jgi:PAS domain S-box-containing protein
MSSIEKRTILVVEDEMLMAATIRHILEAKGYHTLHVPSGEEAIALCTSGEAPVHLVLMDIDLGKGIDGAEAARRILATNPIPVVFMSGHDEPSILSRMESVPSYGYVAKNASEGVLIAAIRMAFSLAEAGSRHAESSARFNALKNSVVDACIMVDRTGRIVDINDAAVTMTGWPRELLLTRIVADLVGSDDLAFLRERLEVIQRDGQSRFEVDLRKPDGSSIPVDVVITCVPGYDTMIGFVTDISARKRQLADSEQAAALYRAMFTHTQAIELLIDPVNGTIVDANTAASEFYGYPLDVLKGMPIRSINTMSPGKITLEMARAAKRQRNVFSFEHRLASGEIRNVEVYSSPIDLQGRRYLNSIIHDVTDRRRAEQAVEQERTRLTSIIEGTDVGTWEWNVQTGETVFNERWADIVGYTLTELQPVSLETWSRLTHPEDLVRSENLLGRHFRGEVRSYEIEIRMRHKAGHWVWILDRGRVREWAADGNPLMMYGTHQDITMRKQHESANEDALVYNRDIIRSIPTGIMTFRGTGEVISANQAAADILGTTVDVLERVNFREVPTWKRTGLYDAAMAVLTSGEPRSLEVRTQTHFGKSVWLTARFVPLQHGSVRELLFVITDIAEHKRTEEKIRTLLEEKELLLREVHHRVKNNMNTMRSILSLQASALPPGPAHDVLKDSEKRLTSMMLLYEKLYKSSTMGMVQVDDYLRALLRDIVVNTSHGAHISLTTEFDGFALSARQMAPVGILVNELVTNAMKYAFTGRTDGSLRVAARRRDATVMMTVADDGVGLPAGVNAAGGGGFGLQLVRLLTEQLGGVLEAVAESGTRWTVRFPMEQDADRPVQQ